MNVGLFDLEITLRSPQYRCVRHRIFRQLIGALLYEGLLKASIDRTGDSERYQISGISREGQPVTYTCQGRRRFSFQRIHLDHTPILRIMNGSTQEADSLAFFFEEIHPSLQADPRYVTTFLQELEATLLNDASAQERWAHSGEAIRGKPYGELEAALLDGHRYHPSYKSRIGFDYFDNVAYGPEFEPQLRPIWLAIHRQYVRIQTSAHFTPLNFLIQELGEQTLSQFRRHITNRNQNPQLYCFIPVHPWQWRRHGIPILSTQIHSGAIIILGLAPDFYQPQQSIRTLANVTNSRKASLKLSLNLINTSTSRILAPHTVQNAPLISDWLKHIYETDPIFHQELRPILLGEVLGIVYDEADSHYRQKTSYGLLGCIWRESLHAYLAPDEQAMPFTGLTALDVDQRPVIEPWIKTHGLSAWTQKMLEVSLLPILHFLFGHGIALEAHAQNMILTHREGFPQRVVLKDFHDGIRFSAQTLAEPIQRPDLVSPSPWHMRVNPNSFVEAKTCAEVKSFLEDAFFFVNLSELAMFLQDQFDLREQKFWTIVGEIIKGYQHRFPQFQSRFDQMDFFAPHTHIEQLTARRLFPDTEPRFHWVPNPLALLKDNSRPSHAEDEHS